MGFADEVVKVKNGFARNFLIPKGKAVIATDSAVKVLEEKLRQQSGKEEKVIADANSIAEVISNLDIKVKELLDQLDGIMRPARAARVIAANSRIEASQADEYLQSLQGVAESVDKAAQVIYDSVQRSQRTLSMINHLD